MSAIQWYNNPKFDAPELGSPQPCIHGAGCVFTVKNAEGVVVPGCCRFVHPGEEGNGRRLFPESVINGQHKSACVRLTGKAGFYERCRLRLPWQEWCARNNIPYTPNKAGERHAPVKRVPIGYKAPPAMELVKSITDDLNKRITASKLTDPEKAECTATVTGAVASLQMVCNVLDQEEESRIEGLAQVLKDSLNAESKPLGETSAKVYRLSAAKREAIVAEVAADPAMANTLREVRELTEPV